MTNANDHRFDLAICPRRTVLALASIALLLLVAHFGAMISKLVFGHGHLHGLVPLFDWDAEKNLPTAFSAGLLLSSGVLLAMIAAIRRREGAKGRRRWAFLAGVFVFLAIDELATIHEMLIVPVRNVLHTGGVFYFAWIIPYSILGTLLAALYFRFLLRLPKRTRTGFLVAAALYLTGALVLEMLGGAYADASNEASDWTFVAIVTVEEMLEVAGLLVFIHTLMTYLATQLPAARIRFDASGAAAPDVSAPPIPSTDRERSEDGLLGQA